jgi:nucleoside 2-deoxyribosyltransferase
MDRKIKKAYFAIGFSVRKKFDIEIRQLEDALSKINIELLVFVDKYYFKPNEEKSMMEVACNEIDDSDILIAELTHKSIGVGIEVGYAFSKKKPILYVRRKGAEFSSTAFGCSTINIEYENGFDLAEKIGHALNWNK